MKVTVQPGMAGTLTFVFAVTAAALVLLHFEPRIGVLKRSVSDARQVLRNDEVAFANAPDLEREAGTLRREFSTLLEDNAQASLIRDLGRIAREHHVRVVSTIFDPSSAAPPNLGNPGARSAASLANSGAAASNSLTNAGEAAFRAPTSAIGAMSSPRSHLRQLQAKIALEGRYRDLLEATAALSRGSELLAVAAPSIRRDANGLVEQVPVTLFVPLRSARP